MTGRERTALAPIFHDLAERIGRRGILVVLSDCFDEIEDILGGLKHLRHKRHEVIVMHVLDPLERSFAFAQDAGHWPKGAEVYFISPHNGAKVKNPVVVRFSSHQTRIATGMLEVAGSVLSARQRS